MRLHYYSLGALLLACVAMISSTAQAVEKPHVHASLLADTDTVVTGKQFTIGVLLKMDPHWHTYWLNAGESGQPTQIKLSSSYESVTFGEVQWPMPAKLDAPGGFSYGYEDEVLLMIPVTMQSTVGAKGPPTISAEVSWLSCSGEKCVEGDAQLKISLSRGKEAHPVNQELFSKWRDRLPTAWSDSREFEIAMKQPLTPELELRWKKPPTAVQFFPEATPSVAIEDVALTHSDSTTRIRYKPTIFKSDGSPSISIYAVVVYEDAKGKHAVRMSFPVPDLKK